jgi:hypothetical protein
MEKSVEVSMYALGRERFNVLTKARLVHRPRICSLCGLIYMEPVTSRNTFFPKFEYKQFSPETKIQH